MFVTDALQKLQRYSPTVGEVWKGYSFTRDGQVIELYFDPKPNLVKVRSIRVRREDDTDDPWSDYSAGRFVDTLEEAVIAAGWQDGS